VSNPSERGTGGRAPKAPRGWGMGRGVICSLSRKFLYSLYQNAEFLCIPGYILTLTRTSPPKVISELSVSLPPRRKMHSHTACASCTIRNRYEALRNFTKPLRNVAGCYGAVTERCRALRNITERCGTLWQRYNGIPQIHPKTAPSQR